MKRLFVVAGTLVLALGLAGCNPPIAEGLFGGKPPDDRGRYVGLGHFTPGRMWAQIVQPATPPPAANAAKPADDEQVIIVMDSQTGEIRQCGNLSGVCIARSPWSTPLPGDAPAPAALTKHAEDLDREEKAATEQAVRQAEAASARPAR